MNDVANNTVSNDSKNMAVLMYILSIFFWFVPSLIMFLVKKDDEFVYKNAVELLNFAITTTIFFFGVMVLNIILAFIPFIGWIAAVLVGLLSLAVGIAALVFLVMGALKVKDGEYYTFPFALRLLK